MKTLLPSVVAVVLVSIGCSAAPDKAPPEEPAPVAVPPPNEGAVTPQTTCGGRPGVFTCGTCDALCGADYCFPIGNGCCQCT